MNSSRMAQRRWIFPRLDSLEDRLVPAIYWDGGGNDFNWANAANWSNDALPGANDDVVIDFGANNFTVNLSSGTQAVHSLTSQAGLNVAGTLDVAASSLFAGPLSLSGTLRTDHEVTVAGVLTWAGGTFSSISGAGRFTAQGGTRIEGGGSLAGGVTLVLPDQALAAWDFGQIQLGDGTRLENAGTMQLASDASMYGYGQSEFINSGKLIKIDGSKAPDLYYGSLFSVPTLINTGSIDVQVGTLGLGYTSTYVINSGSINAEGGTTLWLLNGLNSSGSIDADYVRFHVADATISGSFRANRTELWNGSSTVRIPGHILELGDLMIGYSGGGTLDLTGATFAPGADTFDSLAINGGGKMITSADIKVSGAFTWNGTLEGVNGQGSLRADGGTVLANGYLAGGMDFLNPQGVFFDWKAGRVLMDDGSTFANAGTMELSTDDGMQGGGASVFLNSGALIKRDGSKAPNLFYGSLFSVPTLINSGTIDLQVGTLGLGYTSTYVVNTGSINAASGTTLWLLNGLNSSGTIDGDYVRFHVADATITGSFRANRTELYDGSSTVRISGQIFDFGDLVIGSAGGGRLDLTGATFAAGADTFDSLAIKGGGRLKTSANITVAGPFSWNGILEGVNGQGSLRANGGTVLANGYLAGGMDFLNPQGTLFDWQAGRIQMDDGSTFENAGTIELFTDDGMQGYGESTFINTGALIKRDGSKAPDLYYGSLFAVPTLINTGTIDLQVGTLGLGYVGTYFTNSGTITAAPGTTLWLLNGLNSSGSIDADYVRFHVADATITGSFRANRTEIWNGSSTVRIPGQVLDLGDIVIGPFGGGTLDLTGATFAAGADTFDSLTLSGGAKLKTSANIVVAGPLSWNGVLEGVNGQGSLRANGGTVLANGYLAGGMDFLNPQGTLFDWQAGRIQMDDGSTFENAGTIELFTDDGMQGYGESTFLNTGSLIKRDGSKAPDLYYGSLFAVPTLINTGTIDLQVGTLGLGYVGTYFTNSGTITAAPGTTLWLLNGLKSSGSIDADYVRFHVADATITGSFRANRTEIWNGSSTVRIPGQVLDLGDVVVGAYDGGTLDLSGATFAPGADSFDSLTLKGGGKLISSADIKVAGSFTWNGTLEGVNGQGSLRANGGTVMTRGAATLAGGFDFLNPVGAVVDWNNDFGINLGDGSVWENAGTMRLGDDAGMYGYGQSAFINSGTFVKWDGSKAPDLYYGSLISVPTMINTGTIDLQVGTLGFGYSSTNTINSGSINAASGTTLWLLNGLTSSGSIDADYVRFHVADATITGSFRANRTEVWNASSTVRIRGAILGLGNVVVGAYGGGTLDLTGATYLQGGQNFASLTINNGRLMADGDLFVSGAFAWNASTLEGHGNHGSLTVLSDMTLEGNYTVRDFNLINAANAIWTGGAVTFFGDSRFTNLAGATFDDQVDGNFGGIDTCPIFYNQGLLRKSGGAGTTFLHMQLYNSGSVVIEQGLLNIHCGYVQVVNNNGGGGEIGGNFSGDVSVYNPGELTVEPVSPGDPLPPPTANYTQGATGTLTELIGGLTPGTQYGQIIVNGSVNLNGTLQVALINGFVPPVGSSFTVIDNRGANPIAGTFIGLPEGATISSGLYRFAVSYVGGDGNDLTLTFTGVADIQLGGRAFEDRNANGQQDGGEPALSGVEVKLSGTNDQGHLVSATATTDSAGKYLFANLFPGTYAVTFVKPAGYVTTAANIGSDSTDSDADTVTGSTGNYVLQAGAKNLTVDAGYYKLAELGDFVWYDANANGKQDVGETGIANVKVQLFTSGGTQVGVDKLTDANGKYLFTNLVPGDYYLTFTTPAGYTVTLKDQGGSDSADSDADSVTGKTATFTLTSSQSDGTWDAGYTKKGGISGINFRDVTGNGLTLDDVALLSSFTIQLYRDTDNDGALDIGNANAVLNDALVTTTTTSTANGAYAFSGLAPGTYFVREITPSGWIRTAPALSDYYKVVVGSTEVTGQNFANFQKECDPSWITINSISAGGTILTDASGKPVKDLRGNTNQGDQVTVNFTVANDCGCNALLTLVSYTAPGSTFVAKDAYKQVIFDSDSRTFGPGTYTMTVQNPNGYYQIDLVCGLAIDRFGPEGSNLFYSAQGRLLSADNDGRNLSPDVPASLAGSVYSDRDNDGVIDAGEGGIAGVKITLSGKDALGNAITLVRTTSTDGTYSFAGLPASDANGYKLTEAQPADYNDGKETVGKVNGTVKGSKSANDVLSGIKLTAGQAGIDYLFGELAKASIFGYVYKDSNNDGMKDASEIGIKNVSIVLTGYDDLGNAVSVTVQTDSTGKYSFSGLRPSDASGYTIKETGPSGYKDGKETLGKINGTAIGTKGADKFTGIALQAGEEAIDYLFGELPN